MERETSCCFTGHRRIPLQDGLWLRRMLREEIARLAQEGVVSFLAGGALGFDTMAAQEVLRVRAEGFPELGVCAGPALPGPGGPVEPAGRGGVPGAFAPGGPGHLHRHPAAAGGACTAGTVSW